MRRGVYYLGLDGLHLGLEAEYGALRGDVGDLAIAGDVGLYWGEDGDHEGDVGEYWEESGQQFPLEHRM